VSSGGAWIPLVSLLLALAGHARGDEPKTYRWVGEDGHVYTSTRPPPNGQGVIETPPAPGAKAESPPADPAPAAAPQASAEGRGEGDGGSCTRYSSWVEQWRRAARAVASAGESLDRLRSDTDRYVRRNDSYYEEQLESAEDRVFRAQERRSQIEDDAARAGVPQGCFTE
jgi:hypothetical protein